jgi:hypothetical protein
MITNAFATNGVFGPASYNWICPSNPAADFYAFNQGGCSRLPNGNTISCVGPVGYFVEWMPNGDRVWCYQSPIGGPVPNNIMAQGQISAVNTFVWKVISYPTNYPGLLGRDLTPRGTVELPPDPAQHTPRTLDLGPPPLPPDLPGKR